MSETFHHSTPKIGRQLLDFAIMVIKVILIAWLLRLFILQPFIVEGSSMQPQFLNNDYLVVDKISYRLQEPQRGDIVVFRYPNDITVNYVKRIIGLPGETVRITDSQVYI